MKFCAACGAALEGPSRFCVRCGAPALASTTPPVVHTPQPPTAQPPAPQPPSPPTARSVPPPPPSAVATTVVPTVPPTASASPAPARPPSASVTVPTSVSTEMPPLRAARPQTQVNLPALVVALLALALIAGGVGFLAFRDDGPAGSPTTTVGAAPTTTATLTTTTAGGSTPATSVVSADPAQQLAATRDADRPAVEALVGRWVPQLSAKRDGTQANGITYGPADIVALHTRLHEQFGALLLWTGEYVFAQGDLWVSIVPTGFATAGEALAWCAAVPLDRDNCLAKLITHDPTVGDTAQLQP